MRSPSRSLKNFSELRVARPWDAITRYDAPLPQPESFEVYPNRDSYPFMEEYRFEKHWKVKDFVRGTIRLNGWSDAWAPIFREIEGLERSLAAGADVPHGLLRINATLGFGRQHLAPVVSSFARLHPQLELSLPLVSVGQASRGRA